MNTGTVVVAMLVSGAVGGAAGATLAFSLKAPAEAAPGSTSRREAPATEDRLAREVASLRARVEEMQAGVSASTEEAGRLRSDLEKERAAAAATREKIAVLESGAAANPAAASAGPGGFVELPAGGDAALKTRAVTALRGDMAGLGERMKKVMDLRQKTEEERWAAAREALGLSIGQEEELKAALKERDQALKDGMRMETREIKGADGNATSTFSIGVPDPEKTREARKRLEERVNATLSPDQAKRWRDEGYEQALGAAGGGMAISVSTLRSDGADK
jgi:hypothetical protein